MDNGRPEKDHGQARTVIADRYMSSNSLSHCESEQLHLSGQIQNHGGLLAVNRDGVVSHASANLAQFLGMNPEGFLGRPLPGKLDEIRWLLPHAPGSRLVRRVSWPMIEAAAAQLHMSISRADDGTSLLEFTPSLRSAPSAPPLGSVHPGATHSSFRDQIVRELRQVTGADRAMYYAFHENGDGEVLAEDRKETGMGSYLGLRFPASDVPRIARTLYLKNPWRLIQDSSAPAVPLLSRGDAPPDLTFSDLRSVSPVHVAYMENMGVRTSASFPVIVTDELSALFAVQHSDVLRLDRELLGQIAARVKAFSVAKTRHDAADRLQFLTGLTHRLQSAVGGFPTSAHILESWSRFAPWLLQELDADGARLVMADESRSIGLAPEAETWLALQHECVRRAAERFWQIDCLGSVLPDMPVSRCAGVAAVNWSRAQDVDCRLLLFRREQLQEVSWGGKPDKPVEYRNGSVRITPRKSFARWTELRRGHCRPWGTHTRLAALKVRAILAGADPYPQGAPVNS